MLRKHCLSFDIVTYRHILNRHQVNYPIRMNKAWVGLCLLEMGPGRNLPSVDSWHILKVFFTTTTARKLLYFKSEGKASFRSKADKSYKNITWKRYCCLDLEEMVKVRPWEVWHGHTSLKCTKISIAFSDGRVLPCLWKEYPFISLTGNSVLIELKCICISH